MGRSSLSSRSIEKEFGVVLDLDVNKQSKKCHVTMEDDGLQFYVTGFMQDKKHNWRDFSCQSHHFPHCMQLK